MTGQDAGTLPILLVIEGGRSGERIAIPAGHWSIGRDAASDIVFDDAGVSRRHAVLTSDGAGLTLEDAGSTNGTQVNGSPLWQEQRLADRDEVRLGAMAFRVELPSGSAPVAPAAPGAAAAPAQPAQPVAFAPAAPPAPPAPPAPVPAVPAPGPAAPPAGAPAPAAAQRQAASTHAPSPPGGGRAGPSQDGRASRAKAEAAQHRSATAGAASDERASAAQSDSLGEENAGASGADDAAAISTSVAAGSGDESGPAALPFTGLQLVLIGMAGLATLAGGTLLRRAA